MKSKIIIIILFIGVYSQLSAQNVNQQKYRLGVSYEQNGMVKEAERIFEELIKTEPDNNDFFYSYIGIMKKQSKYSEIIEITENFVKKRKTAESVNLLAELYWRAGRTSDANQKWQECVDDYGAAMNTYIIISQTQIELRLFDKAIATLLAGRKKSGSEYQFSDALTKLYIATNDYKNGFKEIIETLGVERDIANAQGRIYALMVNEESIGYIDNQLKDLANANANNLAIQEMYAWFLRTTGNLNDALEIYVRLDQLKNAKGFEIINFAAISAKDGQFDIALKAYDIIIAQGKSSPYNSTALYGYTRTLDEKLSMNKSKPDKKELELIIDKYEKIIEDYPRTSQAAESRLRLAAIYFDKLNDNDEAIDQLVQLTKEFSNTRQIIAAYIELGKIYLSSGNMTESGNWFRKVMDNSRIANGNEKDEATYFLALKDYFAGNFDEAKNRFRQITLNPESDAANDALNKISFLEDNKTFVEPLANYAKAEYLVYQKKLNEASEEFLKVAESASNSPLGESSLLKAAELNFDIDKFAECRNIINKINKEYPASLSADKLMLLTADSFYEEKNNPEAMKYYTELLVKFPNSIYLEKARKRIKEIRNPL